LNPLLTFCLVLWLHAPTSDEQRLSTALWTGLAVLAALGIAGLLFGLKLFKAWSAAKTVACEGCGRFIDAGNLPACPFCGKAVGDGQQEQEQEQHKEGEE
jgi:hypothetical protein